MSKIPKYAEVADLRNILASCTLREAASDELVATLREEVARLRTEALSYTQRLIVREIRERLKNGERGVRIAAAYNVSPVQISAIKYGKTWSHVQ